MHDSFITFISCEEFCFVVPKSNISVRYRGLTRMSSLQIIDLNKVQLQVMSPRYVHTNISALSRALLS
jgi:hypothetical protein